MEDDCDKEGHKVAPSGDGKCQSDEHGMENNTGLKNSDPEFLSGRGMWINLTFNRWWHDMMMSEMLGASICMVAAL